MARYPGDADPTDIRLARRRKIIIDALAQLNNQSINRLIEEGYVDQISVRRGMGRTMIIYFEKNLKDLTLFLRFVAYTTMSNAYPLNRFTIGTDQDRSFEVSYGSASDAADYYRGFIDGSDWRLR